MTAKLDRDEVLAAQKRYGWVILLGDKDGYHFTAKGVRFLRRWLPEMRHVPVVPHVPTPERTKQLTPEPDEDEPLGSPTGKDIGDMGKPGEEEELGHV